MRFFAKLTFICNICFVIYVVLRIVEMGKKAKGNTDQLIQLPWLQNTAVILGWSAVVVNSLFCLAALIVLATGKKDFFKSWIVIANFIFLIVQLLYFSGIIRI